MENLCYMVLVTDLSSCACVIDPVGEPPSQADLPRVPRDTISKITDVPVRCEITYDQSRQAGRLRARTDVGGPRVDLSTDRAGTSLPRLLRHRATTDEPDKPDEPGGDRHRRHRPQHR